MTSSSSIGARCGEKLCMAPSLPAASSLPPSSIPSPELASDEHTTGPPELSKTNLLSQWSKLDGVVGYEWDAKDELCASY